MVILKVENLCKTFGLGEARVEAVKNVNFEVKKGEFIVVLGPSGSGKSTLLHIIGGMERPSSGRVIVEGRDINLLNEFEISQFRLKNIGFIFQSYNLISILTAKENINLPNLIDNETEDSEYLNELYSLLEIQDRLDHYPSQLSGGQQQRVAIGRALANKPTLVLADEPTGNLDSKNTLKVMELLKHCVNKLNQTIILITHDEKNIKFADRVFCMEDGVLYEEI